MTNGTSERSQRSVASRSATFQFKSAGLNVQAVARQLGAKFIVEGSARIAGQRIRVTAQLIDAETGSHIWADKFDRELSDVFAVQDEIVFAISSPLTDNLVEAAATLTRNMPTASLSAYDHLLRGRAAWHHGSVVEAYEHYVKAVGADPGYATALASVGYLCAYDIYLHMTGKPVDELAASAEAHLKQAIEADHGDFVAQHMIGAGLLCLGKLDQAKQHLELSITLNPYYPTATVSLGCTLAYMGAHREGLALVDKAFQIDPRLPQWARAVSLYIHCHMGDAEAALLDMRQIDNPQPLAHLLMAGCLAQAGRRDEAESYLQAFLAKRPPWYDVKGFARWASRCLRSSQDRARLLNGLSMLGFEVD
jgi:tetratricopeptide (TPR) repeat protein